MNYRPEINKNKVSDTKLRALGDFMRRISNSPVGGSIARIILFGSVAEGDAHPESDVDVLVFGTDHLRELAQTCAAASFEMAVRWGESIEPLIYGSSDLWFPSSYFVYNVLRHGKEMYQMDEETLRRREAEAALGLAREYLKSAENASLHGFYRLAVDGAYNSAELCMKGLLLSKLTEMPKSHGGAVQMFGREYVMPGLAPAELGHRLNLHLQLRNKARYDFHARTTKEDAQASLDLVRDFIVLLEKQLHGEREQ